MTKPSISNFGVIGQMPMQPYERYLTTAYDEGMSLLQRVNKILMELNKIGQVTDSMLAEWQTIFDWVMGEGLVDAVADKLALWLADGTIEGMVDDEVKALIGDLEQEFTFDIETLQPQYLTHLNGIRNAVNQSINVDTVGGHIYTTQSDSLVPEGFYINKLTPSGQFVSAMHFPQGGHGTTIGLDRNTSGNLLIWLYHTSKAKFIQVEYKDNYTMQPTEVDGYTDYTPASLGGRYFTPTFDTYYDYLTLRRNDGRVEIRKREDVRNKVDNVIYYCDIDPLEDTNDSTDRPMQGITSYGKDIYWQSGSSSNAMKISQYDGATHQFVKQVTYNDLIAEDGVMEFRDGFHEPEGLCFFRHPKTGKLAILFAITEGGIRKRYSVLYAINQLGGSDYWDGVVRTGAQSYQFTKGMRALSILDGVTKLSDLTKPGTYYMDNTMSSAFTDFPYPVGDAGWYVIVSPYSQTFDGRQKLIRNSSTNRILVLERVFSYDRTTFEFSFGEWTVHTSGNRHQEYVSASDFGNKLSNLTLPMEYYTTTAQMQLFTDAPFKDAGARIRVSQGADSDGRMRQEIIRNSDSIMETWVRNINPDGTATAWYFKRLTGSMDYSNVALVGGATNPDSSSLYRVANDGQYLTFRGAISIPVLTTQTTICNALPNGWKPNLRWTVEQQGVIIDYYSDGTIKALNNTGASQNLRLSQLVPLN